MLRYKGKLKNKVISTTYDIDKFTQKNSVIRNRT